LLIGPTRHDCNEWKGARVPKITGSEPPTRLRRGSGSPANASRLAGHS
jgi:hypothetical protein